MNTNPRILFIAPSSYPIRNAEANVNAKVLKLLSERGCVVDLVCRATTKKHYQTSDNDVFFRNLNSINVVALDSKPNIRTVWNHLLCLFKTGYVYRGSDWVVPALRVCELLINSNKYDFIYTYNEPSELLGLFLSKKYGIKLIATWNDPYIWKKYPSPYGKGADCELKNPFRKKLIAQIGRQAYMNIFPSTRLRDYMLGYMTNMRIDRTVICPHIVTTDLCVGKIKLLDDKLKIIHSGSLGVERDPETFCKGVRMFLDKTPQASIEFTFLGVFERAKGDYFSDMIEKYELNNYIRQMPPVKYEKSFEIVSDYDVCMLLEAKCKEGIFLPSKIADYIQLNKPVMALSPSVGVINDLYKIGGIEYFADVTSAQSILELLEKVYSDYCSQSAFKVNKVIPEYGEEMIYNTHKEFFSSH